jgi:hypothetical protein
VLAAHEAVADALFILTTEAVDADVMALVASATRRRLPAAVDADVVVSAAATVFTIAAETNAVDVTAVDAEASTYAPLA